MAKTVYGYIRVSTKEQHEDRQKIALREYGVKENNIYLDKLSGKDFNRPAYRKMIKKFKPGDTLVIKSIDRLGRNYQEILEQWEILIKQKKINIVVLEHAVVDTSERQSLTDILIADLVLRILSYTAQSEREFIHQRQQEGIAAAKARGVVFGRPPLIPPDDFPAMLEKWKSGNLSARKAASILNVDTKTFLKWARAKI